MRQASHLCVLAACFVLFNPAMAGAEEQSRTIESRITHVTVYPEWAYVTRSAQVDLPAGLSLLSMEQLPAWIDGESLRVRLTDAAGVTIVGVSTETTYLTRSTEQQVNDAEQAVVTLRDQKEDLQNQLNVLEEEKKYLENLRVFAADQLPKDAAVRPVDPQEMAAVQEYLQQQRLQNVQKITALKRQMRDLEPTLAAAEKKWNDLKGRVRLEQKRIVLQLQSADPVHASLDVSYLISGASWYPEYDARVDSATGKVALAARAIVQQSTGEDWSDASFVLSTIQPYLSREKPQMKPWYIANRLNDELSNTQPDSIQQVVSPYSPMLRNTNDRTMQRLGVLREKQAAYGAFSAKAELAQSQVASNSFNLRRVLRTVEERGTTVEFDIPGSFSVTTDGKPTAMPIGQSELEVVRHYSAVPTLSRSTYLTGELRNTGSFPVLPGSARIYNDGSFTAKSDLPFVAQNEKFDLFLGLEERIKVTRSLDYSKSSTASWSDKRRLTAAYIIEVKNYLDKPATISVTDQIPVSQDKQVTVKLDSAEPAPNDTDKGILTWDLQLAAGETRVLRFEFHLEYPPGISLGNIDAIEEQLRDRK